MEKSFNNIEDFLTDESFRSWVNNPTPELDLVWQNWLAENEDKKSLLDQSRKMILNLSFKEYSPDSDSKQYILEKVNQSTNSSRMLFWQQTWLRAAAVFIAVMAIGALVYFTSFNQDDKIMATSVEMVKKKNLEGVKSTLMLADGSKVYLNSGSTLEYPKTFTTKERVVKLNGEAFFEIAHDSERPFRVKTTDFQVEVLGTKFNVNSGVNYSAVALVEGKVRLQSESEDTSIVLDPGHMATLNQQNGSFKTSSFDIDYITGWKDGYLVFKEASLDEVVNRLHKWYGIEIKLINKPKTADWSYTASFKNESLEMVLLNMSTLRQFNYEIKNDSLIMSFQ